MTGITQGSERIRGASFKEVGRSCIEGLIQDYQLLVIQERREIRHNIIPVLDYYYLAEINIGGGESLRSQPSWGVTVPE